MARWSRFLARAILAPQRACGGIGRRARLRALWTVRSVEVRVLSGALGKARSPGLLMFRTVVCFRQPVDVLLSYGKYVYPVRPPGRRDNAVDVRVSASFHRGGWEVRWRDANGRRRARRFRSEEAARAFDEALAEVSPAARRSDTARHGRSGGIYSYRTADGLRWRFVSFIARRRSRAPEAQSVERDQSRFRGPRCP
jgi:hypothetical protein